MKKSNLKIIFYDESLSKNFVPEEIAKYIQETIPPIQTELRPKFFRLVDNLAIEIARTRIQNLYSIHSHQPLLGEIEYEKKIIENPEKASSAVLYDGESLEQIARKLITKEERNTDYLHIIFTKRLLASFSSHDRRYHARVAVYGFPSLISVTGLVEAPAKPKKYYELRNKFLNLGLERALVEEKLKEEFKGEFIDYEDERLTQIMRGYTLQAIFHHLFNQPFCEDKKCQLYNAHWQEEVINAQIKSGRLCDYHHQVIKNYSHED